MGWAILLALLGLQSIWALPTAPKPVSQRRDVRMALKETRPFTSPTELKAADAILDLKALGVGARTSKALLHELASGVAPLNVVEGGGGYGVEIEVSGKKYDVIFDTGSSDLWLFHEGVKCDGPNGQVMPSSACKFGPVFEGGFQEGQISTQNFNISYADQEFLVGVLGYGDVTVAGVTIDHQEFALVNEGYWLGDGVVSGIIGFAYSSLTSAYTGTNPAADSPANNVHYTNFIDQAIAQKKIDAMFSCVLERGPGGGSGQLALGGLPTVSFDHSFVSTDLKILELTSQTIEQTKLTYYTIIPEGIVLGGESAPTTTPLIVDTGTSLVYLPAKLAAEINAAFEPPSVYVEDQGIFENNCDAIPPKFAITIAGQDFYISSSEMLLPKDIGYDASTGGCVTGIQAGSGDYGILGDVFLKNVVAVFDVGASEMRFAAHENY